MSAQKQKHTGKRNLKVYPKYFFRSYRGVVFPEIRLCGKWLQETGFNVNDTVTIQHEKNKIVITIQESKPVQEQQQ